jgi:glycosyltransferase involved in cell wall biosynthesis
VIESVAVVVPAHDEEELLPACLSALRRASRPLAPVPVRLLVVADACADATAELAHRAGVDVVETRARNVGAARAAGFRAVLGGVRPADLASLWLASTDADTLVAPDWLVRQVKLAHQGWDAVVGTVTVSDWSAHPAHVRERFAASYRPGPGSHPHVHGANLGMTAEAYLAAGGFRGLRTAEDHALVASLAAAGRRILRTSDVTVATSARRQAKAPHGFGHRLASLA